QRRLGVRRRRRGRRRVLARLAQRRREHRVGQRNGTVLTVRRGVRTGPRRRLRRPAGHRVRRLVAAAGGRPGGPAPGRGSRGGRRSRGRRAGRGRRGTGGRHLRRPGRRGHRGLRPGPTAAAATRTVTGAAVAGARGRTGRRILTPVRDAHPVRRLLQPLRRTQQERRLVQIHPGRRRGRRLRLLLRAAVLLLEPADHLTHRQPRPQRRLTTVPGDHQPLRPAVRTGTVRTVLRPHHEPQAVLPHPHPTALVRRHIAVGPLLGALLRLRERHHRYRSLPGEEPGTTSAKPPSTIRFATVSSSGGDPASRDRNASKSSPHGSSSRSTRSAGGTDGSTSRTSSYAQNHTEPTRSPRTFTASRPPWTNATPR